MNDHKAQLTKLSEHSRKDAWEKVLTDLSAKSDIDLSYIDDLGDEPIRDEALRLPYEYAD